MFVYMYFYISLYTFLSICCFYIFFIYFFVNVSIRCYFIIIYIYLFFYLYINRFPYFYISMFSCIFLFYIFNIFNFNSSIICVSDYVLLYMWLNVCFWLCINLCIAYFCASILSYLLCRASHEKQWMLTQCPAPDPIV